MNKFERIFLHCSDSEFGHSLMIREWHVARGWKTIGYSVVICNGYPTADWVKSGKKLDYLEGSVEIGRPVDSDQWFEDFEEGAGVYGWNKNSFHICMIGKTSFSDKVLNSALVVTRFHLAQFGLTAQDVFGHCEKEPAKTCPNIYMAEFRKKLVSGGAYGLPSAEPVATRPLKDIFGFLSRRTK